MWCSNCEENREPANQDGKICCSSCGKVLFEENLSIEPTFSKNAAGQSQLSGKLVRSVQSGFSVSRQRTIDEAYNDIESIGYALGINGGESIYIPASRLYTIALERNFTRGRRKEQVEAACLYITCRHNNKPFLLIDFSEYLRINVYVLGAVFLQLCKLLSLEHDPIVQKPVDPSLFIHRFTDRLFRGREPNISRTTLHIVASMKRDWMQTGRKPSGVCGAALYIAALSHGLSCSKSEIIKVVHICEATLTKRLIEFENTESGSLTIDELNTRAKELEKEERLTLQLYSGSKGSGITEVLCEHKNSVELPFAHGLCESCYIDFIKHSGGLEGGSEPPAFQRTERERLMAKEAAEDPYCPMSNQVKNNGHKSLEPENREHVQISGSEYNASCDTLHGTECMSPDEHDESGNFLDIDDVEVDGYLLNQEEKKFKEIIWVKMNWEYEEQAAKEAAALAAQKAYEESLLANCSEDVQAAQKLAADAATAVAKSRKEKREKRAAELKNSGPAQTAAEATKQMLTKKRLSSKINYDLLEKLFDETAIPENPKKVRKVDDSTDDNVVKSSKIDLPEVEETNEEAFGEHLQYDGDDGGYDYDQQYDYDEY